MIEESRRQAIAAKAAETVQTFFGHLMTDSTGAGLPKVLSGAGTWMAFCDERVLAVFFVSKAESERIDYHKAKGWHPFPGFLMDGHSRDSGGRAAYHVNRPFGYYASKRTSNMFAFNVLPGADCMIVDHLHEVVDTSGNAFTYKVDLVLVLGLEEGDRWPVLKGRMLALLHHVSDLWGKSVAK